MSETLSDEELNEIANWPLMAEARDGMKRKKQEYVYFAHSPDQDAVKIGYSSGSPRIHTLQTGNPSEIYVLGSFPAGREAEATLHDLFKPPRIRGEWFTDDGLFTRAMFTDIHDAAFYAEQSERHVTIEEATAISVECILEHLNWIAAGRPKGGW